MTNEQLQKVRDGLNAAKRSGAGGQCIETQNKNNSYNAGLDYAIALIDQIKPVDGVDINDIKIGSDVVFRDGKVGNVFLICKKVFNGVDYPCTDNVLSQARFFVKMNDGGERSYSYRADGVCQTDAHADIVRIVDEKEVTK
jgi:hypothetical protein